MADPALIGNGRDCPGCGLRWRAAMEAWPPPAQGALECNFCDDGAGRVPIPPADIIGAQPAENAKGPR